MAPVNTIARMLRDATSLGRQANGIAGVPFGVGQGAAPLNRKARSWVAATLFGCKATMRPTSLDSRRLALRLAQSRQQPQAVGMSWKELDQLEAEAFGCLQRSLPIGLRGPLEKRRTCLAALVRASDVMSSAQQQRGRSPLPHTRFRPFVARALPPAAATLSPRPSKIWFASPAVEQSGPGPSALSMADVGRVCVCASEDSAFEEAASPVVEFQAGSALAAEEDSSTNWNYVARSSPATKTLFVSRHRRLITAENTASKIFKVETAT